MECRVRLHLLECRLNNPCTIMGINQWVMFIYRNRYLILSHVRIKVNSIRFKVGDGYHQRGGMGSMQQNRMWMQMPPSYNAQTESLMSGMAGLTLHNIAAKFTGKS